MILHIQVKPGSKKDVVSQTPEGVWKIHIRAPAVDGKANKYLIEYLSNILKLSKSKIEIQKGELNPHKTLVIDATEEYVNNCFSTANTPKK